MSERADNGADLRAALRFLGHTLRHRATAAGVPCWTPADDAEHAAWIEAHGTAELRALVADCAARRAAARAA